MKRLFLRLVFAFCLILVFNIAALAYAPAAGELGVYSAQTGTYDYQSYNIVDLTNQGQTVETDMPAFIIDGRTMVPVRVISEELGANVVWLEETRQVAIDYGDLSILLTIGSAEAIVNGQSVTLPDGVPAILAKYNEAHRTLVPLRFVAETLGADVHWDAENYTVYINQPQKVAETYEVTSLDADNKAGVFTINTSGEASYDVNYYSSKLVIDIFNAKLADSFSIPDLGGTWTDKVRYSQYTGYGDIAFCVRIVFNMADGADPGNVSVDALSDGIKVTGREPGASAPVENAPGFTVVIDAGHGGHDPGATADSYYESEINLGVAQRVRDILQNADVQVVMTRTDDSYVSLSERAVLANASGADIFVSIHTNASGVNLNASGIETYYLEPGGWAEVLADCIQTTVIGQTGAYDRGIKTANDYVLRETVMPAALVEIGFITAQSERDMLFDDGYRDRLAEGIAAGILDYLDRTIS